MSENEIEREIKDCDKNIDTKEERGEEQPEISFENFTETCQHIKQEFLSSMMKWSRAFQESENIDLFFEKRLDELIQEAEQTEESLKSQKHILKEKLKCLTKTLTQIAENES